MGWFSKRRDGSAPETHVPDGTLTIFGQEIPRPPETDTITGFFDRPEPTRRWYEIPSGRILLAGIPPLKRSRLNESRMHECFFGSVQFERLRRGCLMEDEAGNTIFPTRGPHGWEIGRYTKPDGSTFVVIATGLLSELSREEYAIADRHGIGDTGPAWRQQPLALMPERTDKGYRSEFYAPANSVMPLYRVVITEVQLLAAAQENAGNAGVIRADMPDNWL